MNWARFLQPWWGTNRARRVKIFFAVRLLAVNAPSRVGEVWT